LKIKETFIGYADIISPFGQGLEINFNSILSGNSAYSAISKDRYGDDYPVSIAGFLPQSLFENNDNEYVSRSEQILDRLLKTTIVNSSMKTKIDAAFFLYKNVNSYEFYLNSKKRNSFFDMCDQDSVFKIFKKNNIIISPDNIHIIDNTCTTGLTLLTHASQGISAGLWNNCLVCAIDLIDPLSMFLLNSLGALSPSNEDPAKALRPFDVNRNGFVKTESGSIAVISGNAENLDNTAFMKLISFNQSNDAFRITDGREDAKYLKFSMEKAFDESHLKIDDLAFIKTQGIGTKLNDQFEAKAIKEILKESKVPVTSLKGHLGHTADASGLLEGLIAGYALKKGIILPVKNCFDLEFNLNIVKDYPIKTNLNYFLTNSSGFGGNNASAVFGII
jgi:3-oxoacyl-(acyl-carrier-protein) synthase